MLLRSRLIVLRRNGGVVEFDRFGIRKRFARFLASCCRVMILYAVDSRGEKLERLRASGGAQGAKCIFEIALSQRTTSLDSPHGRTRHASGWQTNTFQTTTIQTYCKFNSE